MKKTKQYRPKKFTGKKFTTVNKEREASQSLYNKGWTNYRFRFLHHNPKCYACGQKANLVDHIRAAKGDRSFFWKVDNYIPLCRRCHDWVTTQFDRHKVPLVEDKLRWLSEERSKRDLTTKVKITPFKGENLT